MHWEQRGIRHRHRWTHAACLLLALNENRGADMRLVKSNDLTTHVNIWLIQVHRAPDEFCTATQRHTTLRSLELASSLLPPCVIRQKSISNKWHRFLHARCRFCQPTNIVKSVTQNSDLIIARPHVMINNQTAKERGVASAKAPLWRQYHMCSRTYWHICTETDSSRIRSELRYNKDIIPQSVFCRQVFHSDQWYCNWLSNS